MLQDPVREDYTLAATDLMRAVVDDDVIIRQPTHWLAEVAAVLTRLTPGFAVENVGLLQAMQLCHHHDMG